ncbi:DUF4177 domain-containing protein [haloarchaeon 3A1-DGR]|nr:DUF4177 domain-containing protein [haloarchaeon 3A1-DGR]
MSQDQRFEYKSINLNVLDFSEVGDEKINQLAEQGWQLKEKVDQSGSTVFFIFERPVE